jgi:predicted permease
MQDIRFAIRGLRKQPIFAIVAILTLTLGIGANTAIFSLVYQTLLAPLPYAHADRLVFVWNTYPLTGLPQASVSIPDYLDRRTQAAAIEEATLFTTRSISLVASGQPEQLRALAVTPSFFATLGRQPMLGRGFTESEATPNADKFVILSYGVWASRFGADRALVGRDVRLNGEAYRVVGVLPADLTLPSRDIAALVPFAFTPQQMSDEGRGNEFSSMIARLRPGATIQQLDAQMKVIVSRNLERLPQYKPFATTSGFGGIAVDLRQQLVGDLRTPLFVLQAGVLAVLLIACVNVANLLLMRATGRYRELAIRTTLGAGQWRLVKQLVTEAIVLALLGGAGGLMVGILGVRALLGMTSQQLPSTLDGGVHVPVLAFTLGVALLTGLIFGLVPALTVIRGNTSALLKDDSTRYQPDALHAGRRRDGTGARPADRRGAAHPELRRSAVRRSGFHRRERAHGAAVAAAGALRRSCGAGRVLAAAGGQGARAPGRVVSRAHLERAVQRHGQFRFLLDRGLHAAARAAVTARAAGGRRGRLLRGDAHPARQGPPVQRRRHGSQRPGRRH